MQIQNALAAMTEAVPLAGTADVRLPTGNDQPTLPSAFPPDARAVIHCPGPSVMSSGRMRAAEWVLEFEPRAPLFIEPLMGWTGSTDTLSQVRLRFPSLEAAAAYARRQALRYEIREPAHIRTGDLKRLRQPVAVPVSRFRSKRRQHEQVPHVTLDGSEAASSSTATAT